MAVLKKGCSIMSLPEDKQTEHVSSSAQPDPLAAALSKAIEAAFRDCVTGLRQDLQAHFAALATPVQQEPVVAPLPPAADPYDEILEAIRSLRQELAEMADAARERGQALNGVSRLVETAQSPTTYEAVHAAHGRPLEIDRYPPSRFPNWKALRPSSAGRVTDSRGRRIKVGYTG